MNALPSIAGRDLPPLAYAHNSSHDTALTRPEHFRPVVGSGRVKPGGGGLWTAPVTATTPEGMPADTAWLEWCRAEDFGAEYYTHLTEILPAPGARVLRIDSQADLVAIIDAFPAGMHDAAPRHCRHRVPDWVALAAAGWDAVYLTDEGQWATRIPPSGPDLYSWDLATVLWLRPAYTVGRTAVVTPLLEAAEAGDAS